MIKRKEKMFIHFLIFLHFRTVLPDALKQIKIDGLNKSNQVRKNIELQKTNRCL